MGDPVGPEDGLLLGSDDGDVDGNLVGCRLGLEEGSGVGREGLLVGCEDGCRVGNLVG